MTWTRRIGDGVVTATDALTVMEFDTASACRRAATTLIKKGKPYAFHPLPGAPYRLVVTEDNDFPGPWL